MCAYTMQVFCEFRGACTHGHHWGGSGSSRQKNLNLNPVKWKMKNGYVIGNDTLDGMQYHSRRVNTRASISCVQFFWFFFVLSGRLMTDSDICVSTNRNMLLFTLVYAVFVARRWILASSALQLDFLMWIHRRSIQIANAKEWRNEKAFAHLQPTNETPARENV